MWGITILRPHRATFEYLTQQPGGLEALRTTQPMEVHLGNHNQYVQVTSWQDDKGLDWLIVVVIPKSDFMAQINANTRTTFWLCLGTLTAATLVGVLTARWISRLIDRLNQASHAIAAGDLDQHVEIDGIQELHTLANSFNLMAGQLKTSFTNLTAQNHALQQTQAALQQSEARNQAILNAIPDLILEINQDGLYLNCLEAKGLKWFVKSASDRIGKWVQDVLPPTLAQDYLQAIHQVLHGEPSTLEYEMTVDGELQSYEARVVACSPTSALFIVRNITDRKQAEAALRHSEATNRALITAIPDLLIRANGAGQYLDIIGRDRVLNISEGYTVTTSLPPDRAKQRMAAIQAALTTGTVQIYEHEISKGEDTRYEEVRIVVSGENEVLIMVRDITNRKQAEKALEIAEKNYRSIYENALEGIFQSTPEGHYITVNPAMARIQGYNSPEAMMASIQKISQQIYVDPNKHNEFKQLMSQQGYVKAFEYQAYRQDGSIIWLEEDTRAVTDEQGKLLYYEGIVQDITQRKQAEAALRIAEETYRGIFENALDGIFQSIPEGSYLRVNPALAQLYGYESPEDLINSISDIASQVYVHPSDREYFKHLIEQEGMVTGLEYQVYRADGSIIWISESTCAVRDDHGHLLYYAGIIQDISDRKRREAELRRQLEELRIEIDQKKRQQEVATITESGYFQELQQEIAAVNLDEFWS